MCVCVLRVCTCVHTCAAHLGGFTVFATCSFNYEAWTQLLWRRRPCQGCSLLCPAVLKPVVELLSNPDYINQMLLAQLERREHMNEHHKRAYTYAPSYEEFIKLINSNSDVEFLKQLRYLVFNYSMTMLLMILLWLVRLKKKVLVREAEIKEVHKSH